MDRHQTVDCESICNVDSIESTIKSRQWMVYGMMLVEPENHHCHISFESVLSFLFDDLIGQKDEKLPTKIDQLLIMFQNNMKKNEDGLLEIPVRGFIQSRSVVVSVWHNWLGNDQDQITWETIPSSHMNTSGQ